MLPAVPFSRHTTLICVSCLQALMHVTLTDAACSNLRVRVSSEAGEAAAA